MEDTEFSATERILLSVIGLIFLSCHWWVNFRTRDILGRFRQGVYLGSNRQRCWKIR